MRKHLFLIYTFLLLSIIVKAQLYVTNTESISVFTSGDLVLQEDLNNNGTITNLTIGGSNAQNISGTGTINTLIVNKSAGTVTGTGGMQTITTILTPTAGTLAAAGYITLQSNNTATAYATSGAATISGLNIQHYLTSNQRGWRLIGNPFTTGVTLGSLATASNIDITYGGTNIYGGTSAASAETYVPASNTWTTYTLSSNTWNAKSSIALFIRGAKGEGIPGSGTDWVSGLNYVTPSTVILEAQGTLNVADAAFTVTANKPNIIANPFAAPISLNVVLTANASGFSSTVGYYNPSISSTGVTTKAGGYGTGVPSVTDIIIPPMGSFVITSTSGTSFTVPASAINTSATPTAGVLGIPADKSLVLNVTGTDGIYYDQLNFRFDANATGATGDKYDFLKMANQNFDLYSLSTDNKTLAYDNRNVATTEQVIPLGIRSGVQKEFTIDAINNAGVNVVIKDKLLKTQTDLTIGNSYNFTVTADTATQGEQRFELVLNNKSIAVPTVDNNMPISIYPNPSTDFILVQLPAISGTYNINLTDMNGISLQNINNETGGLIKVPLKPYSNGSYIVIVRNGSSVTSKKILKN